MCSGVTPLCDLVQVIASVQNQLTSERVNIIWLSKRFTGECREKERWFGTQYSREGVEGGGREGEGAAAANSCVVLATDLSCVHALINCSLYLQKFLQNGKQNG